MKNYLTLEITQEQFNILDLALITQQEKVMGLCANNNNEGSLYYLEQIKNLQQILQNQALKQNIKLP